MERVFLVDVFEDLRRRGLPLGVDELVAAQRSLAAGFGSDRERLIQMCQALWAKSPSELEMVRSVVDHHLPVQIGLPLPGKSAHPAGPEGAPAGNRPDSAEPPPASKAAPALWPRTSILPGSVLPAPSPEALLGFGVGGSSLPLPERMSPASTSSYFDLVGRPPISRRQMKQAWRGLRRTHRVGTSTDLSLPGIIDRIHRDGVLEKPVFVSLRQNAARLLLLQDALGSMAPFEKVCQTLGETALQADLGRALVIYFHDVPAEPFYTAPRLSRPADLEQFLSVVAGGSLLIVSDAGAARRRIDEVRVKRTAYALERLRESTSKICWINPVPEERWEGTSAAVIRHATSVPMVPLTYAGLQTALRVLRGKAIV